MKGHSTPLLSSPRPLLPCPSFQDHETLKRSNADLERQVQEWQLALEEAEERYSDLQSKHQTELEGVRKAGHDTLAVIVEEYKVLHVPLHRAMWLTLTCVHLVGVM